MKPEFEKHKESLFKILLEDSFHDQLLSFIKQLYDNGQSKKEIYDLFVEFHGEIQLDPRTNDNELVYDKLCDFMDGFTAWGKRFKILPNEPDI